jgi:hypothetical protein
VKTGEGSKEEREATIAKASADMDTFIAKIEELPSDSCPSLSRGLRANASSLVFLILFFSDLNKLGLNS